MCLRSLKLKTYLIRNIVESGVWAVFRVSVALTVLALAGNQLIPPGHSQDFASTHQAQISRSRSS